MKSIVAPLLLLLSAASLSSAGGPSRKHVSACATYEGNFVVLTPPVLGSRAAQLCKDSGYAPAAITPGNMGEVSSLVYACAGQTGKAWVESWNTDDYGDTCIAVHVVGNSSGTINEPIGRCHGRLPTVCAKGRHY